MRRYRGLAGLPRHHRRCGIDLIGEIERIETAHQGNVRQRRLENYRFTGIAEEDEQHQQRAAHADEEAQGTPKSTCQPGIQAIKLTGPGLYITLKA